MKATVYSQINEDIINAWQSLWESSEYANYTNSPLWFQAVLEQFNYNDYKIIAIYESEKLLAIGALVKKKHQGISFYTVVPNDFVCGMPFLCNTQDTKILSKVIEQMESIGNVLLNNIPEQLALAFQKKSQNIDITPVSLNYFLSLEHFTNGIVTFPYRARFLKRTRGIEEKFILKTYDGTDETGLKEVFHIDDKSRKKGRGYGTFASEEIRSFYRTLATHFKKKILMHILYFEKTPIAYEIGFAVGSTYFGSQISFSDEYAHYYPGKVIVVKTFDELLSLGYKKIDFGSGDSAIKSSITETKQLYYTVVISKNVQVRNYIKFINKSKATIFTYLQKNKSIYKVYRKVVKRG